MLDERELEEVDVKVIGTLARQAATQQYVEGAGSVWPCDVECAALPQHGHRAPLVQVDLTGDSWRLGLCEEFCALAIVLMAV